MKAAPLQAGVGGGFWGVNLSLGSNTPSLTPSFMSSSLKLRSWDE